MALTSILLAVMAPCLFSADEHAPGEADVAAWVADLTDQGEKGLLAVQRLKAAGAEAHAFLEKAAGELEPDLARKLRSRSVLAYRKAIGSSAEKELHSLLTTAAWELPKEPPAFLANERDEAMRLLEAAGSDAIPVLLSTYPEDDYARYALARDILVKRGKEAFTAVTALLGHPAFIARLRAVHLLALIKGDEALELLSKASSDSNVEVRRRVLKAWAEAGGQWALRTAEYLADKDPSIRVTAVRAITGRPEGAEAVAARLADESFMVRKAAAETLLSVGEPGFEALRRASSDAGAALARLEALRALGLSVRPDPQAPDEARQLRARLAPVAADMLRKLLNDPDWAVRAAAAEGLGLAGMAEELRPFLSGEAHPFPRFRIEEALGEAGRGAPPNPARFEVPAPHPAASGIGMLAWLSGELETIDEALLALKMARKDLLFDRNFTRDEFRFPAVQKGLDDPLSLPGIAREAIERLRDARSSSPFAILGALPFAAQMSLNRRPDELRAPLVFQDAVSSLGRSSLPPALAKPLLEFLSGADWHAELGAALGNLDAADRKRILSHVGELGWDPQLLPIWKKVDARALGRAADIFARSVGNLASALAGSELPRDSKGVLWEAETPCGRIVVSGHGPDRYEAPYFLIVDLGGDDLYLGESAAGTRGTEALNAASAVVDLNGDDRYEAKGHVAQGAGFLGLAALVDLEGNDTYRATAHAQGCGWFGAGLLADLAGDDRYDADQVAQGAAGFGFAALADMSGDDIYYARAYAQGFGFTGGVGLLADSRGNDLYYIDGKYLQYENMPHRKLSMGQGMGYGMRPHASGGVGLLWEGGGDDVYRGNAFAQGSSYWFAMGMLVDEEGFDNYSAAIYSQASGIHMGVGFLADLDGDDNYTSWGLSQSGSHDLGVSVMIEASGNDIYTCQDASLGGAINHAVAIFLDRSGRDAFFVKNRMAAGSGDLQGQKDWQSIGIFLDLGGGEDTYPVQKGGNGRFWTEGNCGAGIDK